MLKFNIEFMDSYDYSIFDLWDTLPEDLKNISTSYVF